MPAEPSSPLTRHSTLASHAQRATRTTLSSWSNARALASTVLLAWLGLCGAARAQATANEATTDVAPAVMSEGRQPSDDRRQRLDERTAYTIGARRLKLGLLALDYGITDALAIGTDPPAWAARAVLPTVIPNAHVKLVVMDRRPLTLSFRAGGYFVDLQGAEGASGLLVAVPLSVFASARITPRWWLHGEGTYLFADASGTGDLDNADLEGAVATRQAQLGAMLEYRLSRVVSLTAIGRYQLYSGRLAFSGTSEVDDFTSASFEGQLHPRVPHPWQAVGGAAFVWSHVRLVLGVGYGHYFIPGVTLAVPHRGIVPDLSLAVVL